MKKIGNILFLYFFVFVICMGASFAWYVWKGSEVNVDVNFADLDPYIKYTPLTIKDSDKNKTLTESNSYTGGICYNLEFNKKENGNNLDAYGQNYLKVTSATDSDIFKASNLKWTLVSVSNNVRKEISTGNFVGEDVVEGNDTSKMIPVSIDFSLTKESDNTSYEFCLWLDGNSYQNTDISGKNITVSIASSASTVKDVDEMYIRSIEYEVGVIKKFTAYSSKYDITGYKIIDTETTPSYSDSDWITISSNEDATIESGKVVTIKPNKTMDTINNICIKNENNEVYCKSIGKYSDEIDRPTNALCESNLTYNGKQQQLVSSTSGTGYTLSGYNQKNAGTYTITATLKDNYSWKTKVNDSYTDKATFDCNIKQKTLTVKALDQTINYGESISQTAYTYDGLVDGDILASVILTPSTKEVTDNGTITPVVGTIMNDEGEDLIDNYDIVYEKGKLIIKALNYELSDSNGKITGYEDNLTKAIANVLSGGTIKVLKDNSSSAVTIDKNLTLNTNGKTITMSGIISNSGTVTVTGSGIIYNASDFVFDNSGTLTIINSTFKTDSRFAFSVSGGTVNINGGTYVINASDCSNGCAAFLPNAGTININAGVYQGTNLNYLAINEGGTINFGQTKSLTVSGLPFWNNSGTINFKQGTLNNVINGITLQGGTATVSGGNIVASSRDIRNNGGTVNISGGTLTTSSTASVYTSSGKVNINGGTFVVNASDCSNGCAAFEPTGGTVNINGGTYQGTNLNYLVINSGSIVNFGETKSLTVSGLPFWNNSGTINFKQGILKDVINGITLQGGTANISGGTITASGQAIYSNSGTVTVSGGTLTGIHGIVANSGAVTISGGTIKGSTYEAVYNNGADISITSGSMTGSSSYAVVNYAGTTNIDGGTYSSTTCIGMVSVGNMNIGKNKSVNLTGTSCGFINKGGTLNIYSGTLNTTDTALGAESGTTNISGGVVLGTATGVSVGNAAGSNPILNVTSGSITGTNYAGIYIYSGTVNIGIKDGNVSTTSPNIYSKSYSLRNGGGTWNWYDGSMYGANSPTFDKAPSGTESYYFTKTISDTTWGYKSYLERILNITYDLNDANNVSYWNYLYGSRFSTSYDSSTQLSNLSVYGEGGWEIAYLKFSTVAGKKYNLSFDYQVPSEYSALSGYSGVGYQVLSGVPNDSDNTSQQLVGGNIPTSAQITSKTITLSFTATGTTTYLAFNFGMAADYKTTQIKVGKIKFSVELSSGNSLGTLPNLDFGYATFNGWYVNASGGTKISSSTVPNSNTTYYAKLSPNTYKINYYSNTNYLQGKDSIVAIISGRVFYKKYDDASLAGYLYDGTWTGPLLVGETEESVTMYATDHESCANMTPSGSFEYNGKTYYYSSSGCWYSGNFNDTSGFGRTKYVVSGSDGINNSAKLAAQKLLADNNTSVSQSFVGGVTTNLNANTYTRSNYTFNGWLTAPTGGVSYTDKQEVKNLISSGTLNLYAIWEPKTYSVNYHSNTNYLQGKDSIVAIISGRVFYKKYDDASLAGYLYDGTWTGPLLVGETEESVTMYATDHESCANMTPSGSFEYNGKTYYYSSSGCWYSGNFDDTSGLGRTKYVVSGSDGINNSAKLAAQKLLADNTASISQSFVYGRKGVLQSNTFSRTGYDFSGWAVAPTRKVSYSNASTVSDMSNVTNLYAVWSAKAYNLTVTKNDGVSTIYYKVNGASSYTSSTSNVSVSVTYGTTYYYYGTASTGYTISSCTSSSPCSGTMGTSAVTKTISATINYYNLTIRSYESVDTGYYKINGASSYTSFSAFGNTITLSVKYGSTYYYYATPVDDTVYMAKCSQSSPCSGTMGASDVTVDLSGKLKSTNTLTVSARSLTYTGSAHSLVTASSAQGTVYYAVGTQLTSSNYSSSGSTTIPTGTNAGTYTVYYYTPGNTTYLSKSGSVSVKINSVYPSLSVTLKPDSASSTFSVTSSSASYKCTSSGCSSCSGTTCTTFSSSDWINSMNFSWTNTGYSTGTVFAWNAAQNYTGAFNSSISSSTSYTATTNARSINSGGKRLITITNNGTAASGGLTTKVNVYFAVNGDGYENGSSTDGWYSYNDYWYYKRSGSNLKGSTASSTVSAFWLNYGSDTQYYSFDTSGRNVYAWLNSSQSQYIGYSKMAAAISASTYGDTASKMYYGTKQPIYFTNGTVKNTTGSSSSRLMGLVISPTTTVYYPNSIYSACTNIAFSSISSTYYSCWYDKLDSSTSSNDTSYTCE